MRKTRNNRARNGRTKQSVAKSRMICYLINYEKAKLE